MDRPLPPLFFFNGVLCGACLVLERKRWRARFVAVSSSAIAVYDDPKAWRCQRLPRCYQLLRNTTVGSMCVSIG